MKLYNPFKWHVVEFKNSTYAVRRLSIFWFQFIYTDRDSMQFEWTERFLDTHARIPTYDKASEILHKLNKIAGAYKVKKVYG